MGELLSIGRFSARCRLSIRSLRHYDTLGLLPPAYVDPATGYRYYAPDQVRQAQTVALLRSVDVPLAEIRQVVGAEDGDGTVRAVLDRHRDRLQERMRAAAELLTTVEVLIRRGGVMPYDVTVTQVPGEKVATIREHATRQELGEVIPALIDEVLGVLQRQGVAPAGPPFVAYRSPGDDGAFDLEVGWPVGGVVRPEGRVESSEIPPASRALRTMHIGPYDTVELAYRALTDALDQHRAEPAGPPRERYLNDPGTTPVEELQTEIVWPLR
jgi:DNA-binding transcriptional MerR regulator